MEQFIESGLIEQYVLGLASPDEVAEVQCMMGIHPKVREEILRVEESLLLFAEAQAVEPRKSLKASVLGKISNLNLIAQKGWEPIDLTNPPLLTPQSNYRAWAEAVAHIQPPDEYEGVFMHPIRDDNGVQQFVAFVKYEVEEEVHHDLLESFTLLQGSCECHIWHENGGPSRIVALREGDHIAFKTGEIHEIRITTREPVKAILQWVALAA